ncbi:hypothetical protein M0805_004903 [Coniferiporia weirii]|nr:hypothetical protein M0805_004903 [Coniferiporia weirii]
MSTTSSSAPRRRLSSRRGSQSAPDPYGINAESETTRGTTSRITILPVRAPTVTEQPRHRDRSSWGSAHSASSAASTGRGRVSFALSSFTPYNTGKGGEAVQGQGQNAGPPSPFVRSSSSHSLDRMVLPSGRAPHLTPQQICDLAVSSISYPPPSSPPLEGAPAATPFLLLSDEQYLPFLERPAEVTTLLTTPPTSRLVALLSQTFPADLRAPPDAAAPTVYGPDPAKWSFAELMRWLQTVDRDEADDRQWVTKARQCVLARSELIWSRLKAALGVPPELEEEEEEEEYDDEEEHVADYDFADDDHEGFLEPIYTGDRASCVASPLQSPSGFGARDVGMASIGERAEDEDADEKGKEQDPDTVAAQAIQGLRLSAPMVEVSGRERSVSPSVPLRRALSTNAAPDNDAEARRRDALALAGPGRVRRSAQQEQGTGAPLFPSSFATLTMGPSLVANNPALRSGPRRTFRPGVPIHGRRGRYHTSGAHQSARYITQIGAEGRTSNISIETGRRQRFKHGHHRSVSEILLPLQVTSADTFGTPYETPSDVAPAPEASRSPPTTSRRLLYSEL